MPDISTKKLKANYAEVIDLIYSGHFALVPNCYDYGVEEQTSVNFTIQFNFLKILKVVFLNNYVFQCAVSRCFIIPVRSQITSRRFQEKCFHAMGFDNNNSDVIHTKRGLAGTRKIIWEAFFSHVLGEEK